MRTLQDRLTNFQTQIYHRVKRDRGTYADTLSITVSEITRLITLYHDGGSRQHLRLLRDAIDHWLRRYHHYYIKGSIGTHYRSREAIRGRTIFEHVIPAKNLRDMLLTGTMSISEALNAPVCRITIEQDRILKQAGFASRTPDPWHFFRRYDVLRTYFYRVNDEAQLTIEEYSLEDHYNFYSRSDAKY